MNDHPSGSGAAGSVHRPGTGARLRAFLFTPRTLPPRLTGWATLIAFTVSFLLFCATGFLWPRGQTAEQYVGCGGDGFLAGVGATSGQLVLVIDTTGRRVAHGLFYESGWRAAPVASRRPWWASLWGFGLELEVPVSDGSLRIVLPCWCASAVPGVLTARFLLAHVCPGLRYGPRRRAAGLRA